MKYESMSKKYKETLESPITPEDIPAFSKVDKFKPKKSKNFRITQVTSDWELGSKIRLQKTVGDGSS